MSSASPPQTSTRDPRLDLFRGIALLAIGMNHCYPPYGIADRGHYQLLQVFAFNFADVFVFISGLVCGLVYTRVFEREGVPAGIRKSLRRALSLFVVNAVAAAACVGMLVGFAQLGVTAKAHHLVEGGALASLVGTVLLYDPIPFFNMLNLYILLLALLPFGLAAYLKLGRVFLAASFGLWALVNLVSADALGPFAWLAAVHPFFGVPAAWQFVFFLGVAISVERMQGHFPELPVATTSLLAVLVLVAGDFAAQEHWAIHHFNRKELAGLARIVDLLAVSYLISVGIRPTAKLFSLFWVEAITACGRNSLVVFGVTLVACYLASLLAVALDAGVIGYALLLGMATAMNLAAARWRIAWLDGKPSRPR